MALTGEQKERKYKYYLERHDKYEKWHESLSHNLDKLIFGLASGTLVLSVTFIDKFIGNDEIQNLHYIKISWLLLFATLIINIITYVLSMQATVKARKILKTWFNSDIEETPDTSSWQGKTTNGLNIFSLIILTLGILFLAFFAINNINIINTMDNNDQNKQEEQGDEKSVEPHTDPEFEPMSPDKETSEEEDSQEDN